MQVSVENTSVIGRRLTVSIPAGQLQSEIEQRVSAVLRNKKIDGFRPGKVPKDFIQQKFGLQIRHEAISKIIESSLPTALQQESLEPAGRPEIEEVSSVHEEGKDLTYVVSFEIFPEIQLPALTQIKVEKYQLTVTEKDIDDALSKLQNQLAEWIVVDRSAKLGDKLTVDYTSLLNGKPYEHNSGQDVSVELGSKLFIEGFEESLLGVVAGEKRECDLHFPSDWRVENLAGKPVHFSIEVKEVSEKKLSGLDEAFAKKIGANGDDIQAIRQKVAEDLEKQLNTMNEERTRKIVLDQLLKLTDITIPKALIQNEMSSIHEDLHRRMGDKAHDSCEHHGLEEEAKRRVGLSLILRKIVKLENITPDENKVREKISSIAKSFGNAEFIESMYYKSEELLSGIRNSVLVEQAIDLILTQVAVDLKSGSVEEFLQLRD